MEDVTPEPEGLSQYTRGRIKPRHILRMFFTVAAIFLLGGSALGLVRIAAIFEDIRSEEDIVATLARERARFTEAFSGLDITPGAVASGFWYTYVDADGNEHVLYFDPTATARQNLSDSELQQLTEVLSKSRITDRSNMRVVPETELPLLRRKHAIFEE